MSVASSIQPDALAQTLVPGPGRSDLRSGKPDLFGRLLDQAGADTGGTEPDELRKAAEMFVSTSMIMPLFARMREDPLAANLMHGGRAEKVFQQQLDQTLSDRIANATKFDLVDAVYNQLKQDVQGGGLNLHG